MEIESQIQSYIAQNLLFSGTEFNYSNDDSFLEEGIVDSLGVMELVSFVEDQYGLKVNDYEITPENFDSVNKLSKYVRQKMGNS